MKRMWTTITALALGITLAPAAQASMMSTSGQTKTGSSIVGTSSSGTSGASTGTISTTTSKLPAWTCQDSFDKSWSKSGSFGNDTFAAGYDIGASLTGTPDSLGADAHLTADATVFGNDFEVARVEGNAGATYGDTASAEVSVYLAGAQVYSKSTSTELSISKSGEQTVARYSAQFMVGPVPVTVSASADVNWGITFDFGPKDGFGVGMGLTPDVGAGAAVEAGVGVAGVSAGVEGSVDLVDLAVPFEASLSLGNSSPLPLCDGLDWSVSLDLTLSTLDGTMTLYVDLPILGHKTLELFSWNGFSKDYSIAHASGTVAMAHEPSLFEGATAAAGPSRAGRVFFGQARHYRLSRCLTSLRWHHGLSG